MAEKINHDNVIRKVMSGEALNDDEQAYITSLANKQKNATDKAQVYQAKNNLYLRYAKANYEPTDEEIEEEVKRIRAAAK